jgi:hypothetical protein
VAGDVTCKKPLAMADGGSVTAVAIQRHYLDQAEAHLGDSFMPAWAAEVCHRWRAVLDQLEGAPGSIQQTLDWGIKLALYSDHARRLGVRWDALPFWNRVIDRLAAALGDGEDGENGEKPLPLELALGPKSPIPKEVRSLTPLLRSRGFIWEDLKTLLQCRQKFFEIDMRFGQLGPKGIFQPLDLAGVLNHRISGVDDIEQAVAEPPAAGRARIRGQAIRHLAAAEKVQCDWQHIVDFQAGKILDLSDPFACEESWRPLSHEERESLQMDSAFSHGGWDTENAHGRHGLSRRQEALDRFLCGDYAGAEALLRGLLQESFEVPSTHCHLARVLMMMDREGEAREQITQALAAREQADAYVVPRILFFQCVFAMFDGASLTTIVGQIKAALGAPGGQMDWTIQPMLAHLRARFAETNYQFLKALAEALSDTEAEPRLNAFPQWRDATTPSDLETAVTGTQSRRQMH